MWHCKHRTNFYGPLKPILLILGGIGPPMEILVNSWLKPARWDDCTNSNSILTESWGCGEIKNVILQSVQTANKLLRAIKHILPLQSHIEPPMEILVNSRLKPSRCDDCTNGKCILTESWGCDEVIMWVFSRCKQRTNLRSTKPILPIHRGIAPPMEILVNSRLNPARCDDSTNANCILTESWGCWEAKNVIL